ncbi:MAG: zinc ribbon domain-containing protein [Clostridiales bacterium]|nr:zinc ribbon domain-containing protein [Clostridiales bacterium]
MPFYDLCCSKCNKEFNILATVAARMEKQIACPKCGSYDLSPVFKAAHFQIKKDEAPACPNSHICGAGCHHGH